MTDEKRYVGYALLSPDSICPGMACSTGHFQTIKEARSVRTKMGMEFKKHHVIRVTCEIVGENEVG